MIDNPIIILHFLLRAALIGIPIALVIGLGLFSLTTFNELTDIKNWYH
jgi:heme/copper-type cytochrome/quinol oxidase subunit 2